MAALAREQTNVIARTSEKKTRIHRPVAACTINNSLWNVLPLGWSFLLGLLVLPIIIRQLGIEHFGLYGIFAVLLAPLGLANLGFGEATIKFLAEYVHARDWSTATRYLRTTLWMSSLVGLVGAVLLWVLGPLFVTSFFKVRIDDAELIKRCCHLVALGWLFNQIGAIFMGAAVASQKFKTVAVLQIGQTTVTTGLSLVLVILKTGLWGYVLANTLGNAIGAVAWGVNTKSLLGPGSIYPKFDRDVWKKCFRFGGWQALAQIGALLSSQIERFLLGVFLSPGSVGLYNIALAIEQRVYQGVFKMSEVLFPMFSALSCGRPQEMANRLMRVTWLLTTLAASLLIPLLPLGYALLTLWMGPEVALKAVAPLRFLAVAGTLGCASNATYFFLLGQGNTKPVALLSFAAGLTTALFGLFLLPRFGLKAAACPSVAAMITQQVVLSCYLRKRVFQKQLSVGQICTSWYLPVVTALGVSIIAASLGISQQIDNWLRLIISYAAIAFCSAVCVLLSSIALPAGKEHLADVKGIFQWGVALVCRR